MTGKTLLTLALAGTIALSSCGKREYSEVKHEEGIVTEMNYIPAHIEESLSPVLIPIGDSGLGMSAEGDIGIRGSVTNHEEEVPDSYEVKIKTENKTFNLNNSGDAERVYNKLKPHQRVDVSYKEVYRAFYRDTNKDRKKELIKRKIIDYKFLDANAKK
jgi:hypothetical protein